MRKVILYIAMSLDGYIADRDGKVDWLDDLEEGHAGDYGYGEFMKDVDTVILGYRTYRQIVDELSPGKWLYAGMTSYVLTHQTQMDTDEIKFVHQPAGELIQKLKQEKGKHIWVCGGADVVQQLMKEDMIDEYQITIMPKLLGAGVQLFSEGWDRIPLKLLSSKQENGAVICVYQREEK